MRMRVLLLAALLFCSSHQFGMNSGEKTSLVERTERKQRSRVTRGSGYSTGVGPYDIEIEILRVCDDPGTDMFKLRVEPYNTKTDGVSKILYRGNLTVPFTQDEMDALNATLSVYSKKQPNFRLVKYEENVKKTCEKEGKDVFKEIVNKIGLKGDTYSVPKGNYSFKDLELDIKIPPPVLQYGNYKAIMQVLHEKKPCLCVEAHGIIKQKSV